MRIVREFLISLSILCLIGCFVSRAFSQDSKRSFTVADDIELFHFITGDGEPPVRFSPDGKYFAVYSERGRVKANQVEDSLRFFRTQDVQDFLAHQDKSQAPSPLWVVCRTARHAGAVDEGIIKNWKWLGDSSGVAFLDGSREDDQLTLADFQKKKIEPLTSAGESVQRFDVRDRNHYVYTAAQSKPKLQGDPQPPVVVGTGRDLDELIFADDPRVAHTFDSHSLWAVIEGRRFEVKHDGATVVPSSELVLSPDGYSLITEMPAPDVPKLWETLYPPPFSSSQWKIRAGQSASEFMRIELQTGAIQSLTNAPDSWAAGWDVLGNPAWSNDGKEVVLPGTFIESKNNAPARPCVAVVNVQSKNASCVEILKARTETGVEPGFHRIFSVQFASGHDDRLFVTFQKHGEDWFALGTTEYGRAADGTWQVSGQREGMPDIGHEDLEVKLKQALDQPPLLVAASNDSSRVIWDPNPRLAQIQLPKASLYTWKDKDGRPTKGGLFKPPDYKSGQRYPLVIQTHGFDGGYFMPSGSFPTAFAASELAAMGIMVLQAEDGADGCATSVTPQEGPCAVSAYESAARQLVADGLVDPERMGIIGFSRSCYYVMETLTTGSLHFKAAAITDGIMLDYFQYMQNPEHLLGEGNAMIGAPPFGEGLQLWLKRSPGFNLDKVNAPLRVVAVSRSGVLDMWAPYAGLHYLKKPVDLVMLNATDHVFSNPTERMTAQSGTVDWFRFWLQGYEDPDPAKADQYKRWRELKNLQAENEKKSSSTQVSAN